MTTVTTVIVKAVQLNLVKQPNAYTNGVTQSLRLILQALFGLF